MVFVVLFWGSWLVCFFPITIGMCLFAAMFLRWCRICVVVLLLCRYSFDVEWVNRELMIAMVRFRETWFWFRSLWALFSSFMGKTEDNRKFADLREGYVTYLESYSVRDYGVKKFNEALSLCFCLWVWYLSMEESQYQPLEINVSLSQQGNSNSARVSLDY